MPNVTWHCPLQCLLFVLPEEKQAKEASLRPRESAGICMPAHWMLGARWPEGRTEAVSRCGLEGMPLSFLPHAPHVSQLMLRLPFSSQTTNTIYPQSALQVAAYAKALGEMTGTPVDEVPLPFPPTGRASPYVVRTIVTGLGRSTRQGPAEVASQEGDRSGPLL
jgi:hypothetical protein